MLVYVKFHQLSVRVVQNGAIQNGVLMRREHVTKLGFCDVQVCKATSVVVMNCAEIEIQSAKCVQGDLGESCPT